MPTLYAPEEKVFDYDDVILVPKKCVVTSRSQISVSANLGGREFTLPVIPANMSTIVNKETCLWLAEQNIFYIMHRFDVNPVEFTREFQEKGLFASISLGIKQADYDFVDEFVEAGLTPEYITVDVAHGDSEEVFRVIRYIKEHLPQSYVIAGNVATSEGAHRLVKAGVNAVKVGVAPGLVCLTGPNTGFGSRGWQLSALALIAPYLKEAGVQLIADGGIRQYGDIAKSVAFGADMVMIGGMLAGHDVNPGEVVDIDGVPHKAYFGSASEHQKGESKHVEGKKIYVPYKGSMKNTLQTIKENLQSSVSYAGGKTLNSLRSVSYVLLRK